MSAILTRFMLVYKAERSHRALAASAVGSESVILTRLSASLPNICTRSAPD